MWRLFFLVSLAIGFAGCSYQQTNEYEKGKPAEEVAFTEYRTVAVPSFENRTSTPGIESAVTQSVQDAIKSRTTYLLKPKASADTAIEGRILEVWHANPASTQPSDLRKMRIEFTWRDLWMDKTIIDTRVIEVADAAQAGQVIATMVQPASASPAVRGRGKYAWHSLYRQDIATVAVPIFTNKSMVRGVEFQLTKAVINYMESTTPYKVMPRDSAETILEGEIVAVKGVTISTNSHTALPQEEMITVSVNFTWKDQRTGRVLVQRKGYEQSTMYYPTLGEAAYVGTQSNVEKLAVGIVQELQAEW